MKKTVISTALALSVLVSGNAFAASPNTTEYDDGRYNTSTLSTYAGWDPGDTTYLGERVTALDMNTVSSLPTLYAEPSYSRYLKAKATSTYVNEMLFFTKDNIYYRAPMRMNEAGHRVLNSRMAFNNSTFNYEFTKLVNAERQSKGLASVTYAAYLQPGADVRADELAWNGSIRVGGQSHVRLDGRPFYTAFESTIPDARYRLGENLLMTPYQGNPYEMVSERYMADRFFAQWKASSGHYEHMMSPSIKRIATSVKIHPTTELGGGIFDYFTGAMISDNR